MATHDTGVERPDGGESRRQNARSSDDGTPDAELSKRLATNVSTGMHNAVEELAYKRRINKAQLLRRVLADECCRACEIEVEEHHRENVVLIEREPG